MRTTALGVLQRAPRLNQLAPALAAAILAAHAAQAADDNKLEPASPPVPLGVFGDSLPGAGSVLLTLLPQFQGYSHSLIGTQRVSSAQIAATTPWYWSPLVPVRIVPQRRLEELQSLTLSYGVTNDISVVLNTGWIEKHIDQMTFYGTSGIIPSGISNPGTESLQDSQLAGIWRVYQDPVHRVQVSLGMSFPTGSDHDLTTPFQPAGVWTTGRAFYSMETGTGTFDVMPGILYGGALGPWSWGLSYRARLPLGVNPEGYMWGNYQEVNGWAGYTWLPGFTTTFRVNGNIQDRIVGVDPWIVGKIQNADPNFYGGKRIELFGGASLDGKLLGFPGVSLLVEGGIPVYQDLNGPQLSKNWQASAALRWKIGDQPAPTAVPGLPSLKEPPSASPSLLGGWNGLYLGLNGGYTWNSNRSTNFNYVGSGGGFVALWAAGAVPSNFGLNSNGFVGGGQVGYNYQLFDKGVIGFESDLEGVAVGVSAANWLSVSPLTYVQGLRSQHTFGTVRGRVGFLVTPAVLVYGTTGLAYGEADLSAAWFAPTLKPALNAGGSQLGRQDMRTGWTGGGGVEWMFLPKWSAKLEYLHYDLGTETTLPLQAVYGAKGLFSYASCQARFNGDLVRAGVNYHFNWGVPGSAIARL